MDYASLFWGSAIGAVSSWWITHLYYEKSSRELRRDLASVTSELKVQLDMLRASEIFAGLHLTRDDDRYDYGEPRFISVG